MESGIVHKHLNNNSSEARNMLICYLQYLVDYRRDVPHKEEYITDELHALAASQYARQLQEDDPVYQALDLARQLEQGGVEGNKHIWVELRNIIFDL